MALCFAIHDPNNFDANESYIENCAVWVLNPTSWNRASLKMDRANKILSHSGNDFMAGYLPMKSKDRLTPRQSFPVAIEGRYNSPQILALRGAFMIYGSDTRDMEEIYLAADYEQASSVKLEIPKNKIEEMRISLCKIGITDSAMYLDLQGLATEMRRTFRY